MRENDEGETYIRVVVGADDLLFFLIPTFFASSSHFILEIQLHSTFPISALFPASTYQFGLEDV
jgi:hypothetical protein